MWSPCPWLIVMTSIFSKVLCSLGHAGLPSIHGSISTSLLPRVWSLKVLWPSQVSAKPRFKGMEFSVGAARSRRRAARDLASRLGGRGGRAAAHPLEPGGEVAQHPRPVGDAQAFELLAPAE